MGQACSLTFLCAMVAYNQALERNPNYPDAYLERGIAYGSLGNFDHALAEFNRAIALNAELADPYLERGLFYQSLGRPGDAIRDLERSLAISTDPQGRKRVEQALKKLR